MDNLIPDWLHTMLGGTPTQNPIQQVGGAPTALGGMPAQQYQLPPLWSGSYPEERPIYEAFNNSPRSNEEMERWRAAQKAIISQHFNMLSPETQAKVISDYKKNINPDFKDEDWGLDAAKYPGF